MTLSNIMLLVIPAIYFASFTLFGYHLLSGVKEAMGGEGRSSQAASKELEALFLFIPAQRIASLSQSAGLLAFFTGFLVFGNPMEPSGFLSGVVIHAIDLQAGNPL